MEKTETSMKTTRLAEDNPLCMGKRFESSVILQGSQDNPHVCVGKGMSV